MDLQPWDPWQELDAIRGEVDHILERFLAKVRQTADGKPIAFFPDVDLVETAEDLRLFLSLPGVVEEDIEIALEGDLLIIRGEREAPYDAERIHGHLAEWRYGYFERRLALPGPVERADISASYQAGVLTIVIPKAKGASGG